MTPAEHYREAERLLVDVTAPVCTDDADRVVSNSIAAAQVHASLAHAGAAFLAAHPGMYPTAANAFVDVVTAHRPISEINAGARSPRDVELDRVCDELRAANAAALDGLNR